MTEERKMHFYAVYDKKGSHFTIYREHNKPDLTDYYLERTVENDRGQVVEHWRPKTNE